MDEQGALARACERNGVVVENFEIVDAIDRGVAEHGGFAVFVAAGVDGHCAPPYTKVWISVTSVLRGE